MAVVRKEGFPFEFNQAACGRCSANCCRGRSGNVWVTFYDICNICNVAGVNLIDGMNLFFEKRLNRYSIREKFDCNQTSEAEDYCCIFLDSASQCSIYPVRPIQCRTFPFWEHFKTDCSQMIKECPGVKPIGSNSF